MRRAKRRRRMLLARIRREGGGEAGRLWEGGWVEARVMVPLLLSSYRRGGRVREEGETSELTRTSRGL